MLRLFLSECEQEQVLLNIIFANINVACVAYLVLIFRKIIASAIYILLFICLFLVAVTSATSILCILVFQIGCLSYTKHMVAMVANFSHYIIK